jgi:drug/metabolite transporter (DMT)-like permease
MAEEKKEEKPMRTQVIETIAALITAAFGLIAALAWNTAISDAVKQYLSAGNAILAEFIYAILVTILAVVATVYIGKVLSKYHKMASK